MGWRGKVTLARSHVTCASYDLYPDGYGVVTPVCPCPHSAYNLLQSKAAR